MNAETSQTNDQMELIRASVTLSNALMILSTVITQMATLAQEAQEVMLLDDLAGSGQPAPTEERVIPIHRWN